jgi:DNA (cytosine-5)-methyltransferase 1
MRFGSICSGIEAASVAWDPLGWRPSFLSEIAAFPRAVLQHRYPKVSLHGDFTTIQAGDYEPIDVLIGGTPCQDFSVAGLRAGITGDRGNLTLEFIRLAQRLRPTWIVFENVPGLLSDDGGRAFGAFLGGLAVIGYGFAYRVLDAQFAGLAQRRERVFVIGYLGDWRPAAAVLFERHGLSWNPPPRRGARQEVAGSLTTRAGNGSRPAGGNDNLVAADAAAGDIRVRGLRGDEQSDVVADVRMVRPQPLGLGPGGELARSLNACHTASGRHDVSVDTFVASTIGFNARQDPDKGATDAQCFRSTGNRGIYSTADTTEALTCTNDPNHHVLLTGNTISPQAQAIAVDLRNSAVDDVAMTLQAGGIGEDRGMSINSVPHAIAFDTTQITHPENRSNPQPGDPCHPLAAQGHAPALAYVVDGGVTEFLPQSSRVYLDDGVSPTLQATGKRLGQRAPAVAFQTRIARNGRGSAEEEIVPALNGAAAGATSDMRPCVATPTMAVRRLTPRECERLQGFPDDWTLVPYRGKPAKDGPRYQALGNSMAVPVVSWLGRRIDMVDRMLKKDGNR